MQAFLVSNEAGANSVKSSASRDESNETYS